MSNQCGECGSDGEREIRATSVEERIRDQCGEYGAYAEQSVQNLSRRECEIRVESVAASVEAIVSNPCGESVSANEESEPIL